MSSNSTSSRQQGRHRRAKWRSIFDHDQALERRLREDRINRRADRQWFIKDLIEALMLLAILLFVGAVALGALYL